MNDGTKRLPVSTPASPVALLGDPVKREQLQPELDRRSSRGDLLGHRELERSSGAQVGTSVRGSGESLC